MFNDALFNSISQIKTGVCGKVRRYLLGKFYRKYITEREKERKGECLQCGNCCRLLFRCPFLVGSNGNIKCLIYNSHVFRPRSCRDFPIDPQDLADVKFQCGYHFSNTKS